MGRLRQDLGRLREKTRRQRRLMAAVGAVALVAVACKPALTGPTTGPINFESYSTGNIDGQDGWTHGTAGVGCVPYDHAVSDGSESDTTPAAYGFGSQSLRMSDAFTSGCFDQTFSKPTTDEAGETSASLDIGHTGGTRRGFFESSWSFASAAPAAVQNGLHVVASPDRGDGARMSWVEMQDCSATPGPADECQDGDGLEVDFFEYDTGVGDFVFHNVASGLSRSVAHNIRLRMWFFEGPNNDVVQVCVDTSSCVVGHSWEDYFREVELNPTRTVDSLDFRTGGTANPSNVDNGFFIDNVKLRSGNYTGAAFSVTGPSTVAEGNVGSTFNAYTVTLSEALPFTTTVHYATGNGSATAPGDYTSTSGDLTFLAGETSHAVVVPVKGDTIDEADETFTVNLSNPQSIGLDTGAESYPQYAALDTASKTTTITDDDTTLRINDPSIQEGDSGTTNMGFIVTLDYPSTQTVTVHVQTKIGSGTATAGSTGSADYVYTGTNLTFTPGQTAKTFNVPIRGDTVNEPNETFNVLLTAPTNAAIGDGSGTGTIVNDD